MNAHLHDIRLSRPQIVAAFVLTFSALALVLSRVKSDQSKSEPVPTIIASHSTKPAPQVEQVRLRADVNLTNPLLVEVTGRDFVWHFRYSGPDGILNTRDDISTSDVLYLPCDQDIRFVVHSDDYVYYLSIPELDLRQIAIPELTFEKTFRTTRMGVFEMPVDPMCGMRFLHEGPMGRVIVQQKSSFLDSLSEFASSTYVADPEHRPSSR